MDVYRTPDQRFERLQDYPFAPSYREIDGLRMHYVDLNPGATSVVLLLHGEPTWSYLYRHMIPRFAQAGLRVVAPDLIGFGKSDKPTRVADYSYARHVAWLRQLVCSLELQRITLFCQDWGSLVGLRVLAEEPERFERVAVGNGALPVNGVHSAASLVSASAFLAWRAFARLTPRFPTSGIVGFGCRRKLSAEERRAYDAPFPVPEALAGARAFPLLVPIWPNDPELPRNRVAWQVLDHWHKPFLTTFSDGDPITRGGERIFRRRVPGAQGQPHFTPHGGHFLQEDAGPELATRLLAWLDATRLQPMAAEPT